MSYWLIKSEPEVFSLDDLAKKPTLWDAVRNYQARNSLKQFAKGDLCLYYHSNASPSGIVGVAECITAAVADPLQFDSTSEYYDEKATKKEPRWFAPEVAFQQKFQRIISLDEIKKAATLKNMALIKLSRLSVTPVTAKEFETIVSMSNNTEKV